MKIMLIFDRLLTAVVVIYSRQSSIWINFLSSFSRINPPPLGGGR